MAHRTARLNVFGRQLLVTRIELDGWPVAKAAEAQGVSRTTAHKWVAPLPGRGLARPRGPQLAAASLAAPDPARGGRGDPARPGRPTLGTPPPGTADWVIRARPCTPSSPAPATAGCATPIDSVGVPGPLRPRPPGRARPPGPQEARPDPRRWRPPAARSLERGPRAGRAGLGYDHFEVVVDDATRLAYVAHVPDESARSASPGPARCGGLVRRARRPHRARPDRQRAGPTRARPTRGALESIERPPPADPALPAPDQRQGRAVHQDPARRVGLRPAVPDQRRAARRPAGLGRRLQHRADPHRARWHHPDGGARQQPPWESQLAAAASGMPSPCPDARARSSRRPRRARSRRRRRRARSRSRRSCPGGPGR